MHFSELYFYFAGMKNIIDLISHRQEELGLTNKKMAGAAEITPKYYASILKGQHPGVSYGVIDALCKFVGLELLAVYNPSIMSEINEKKEIQTGDADAPAVETK